MPVPVSPCVNVCRIDPARGWCAGCLRTLAEIKAWKGANDEQRRGILRAAALRRDDGAA